MLSKIFLILQSQKIMKLYKITKELISKRREIRETYIKGIGEPFLLLRYILPIVSTAILFFIISKLSFDQKDIHQLIKQLNSLIGIILGFSIASFAIFISINNDELEETSGDGINTYREIGSALFFYNVEISLFISLLGIMLTYCDFTNISIEDFWNMIKNMQINQAFNVKIVLFVFYIFMFFQLIFNLFYSSIFLNSSIKK